MFHATQFPQNKASLFETVIKKYTLTDNVLLNRMNSNREAMDETA